MDSSCMSPNLSLIPNIEGIISIPLRIIVLREVNDANLIPLKIMNRNADEEDVREFIESARRIVNPGEKRGEKRGADKMLIELVHDGGLDISIAAKRAKMSMKKFREELETVYPTK